MPAWVAARVAWAPGMDASCTARAVSSFWTLLSSSDITIEWFLPVTGRWHPALHAPPFLSEAARAPWR
ncbi:hypothetical protein [Streptomyces enissocaesilis]|uniref:Secreted protein n=1 Tax=Streptomyces enissocaesilis TaxID=332589 RepID=A0ABP6K7Z9_9ACTN